VPRFVALLRGINVGRAKRVAMADLRALLESLGYREVRTLLNSGNVAFEGAAMPQVRHARRIRAAVAGELGVDALVIVKSAEEVAAIVAGNQLAAATASDPSRLLVALTHDAESLAALASLAGSISGADELHVGKHAAYVWCANGILESKAAVALLRDLGDSGTTRNWATVNKLHALLQSAG
jgi:uncharacterized protein (DUF1697 family)